MDITKIYMDQWRWFINLSSKLFIDPHPGAPDPKGVPQSVEEPKSDPPDDHGDNGQGDTSVMALFFPWTSPDRPGQNLGIGLRENHGRPRHSPEKDRIAKCSSRFPEKLLFEVRFFQGFVTLWHVENPRDWEAGSSNPQSSRLPNTLGKVTGYGADQELEGFWNIIRATSYTNSTKSYVLETSKMVCRIHEALKYCKIFQKKEDVAPDAECLIAILSSFTPPWAKYQITFTIFVTCRIIPNKIKRKSRSRKNHCAEFNPIVHVIESPWEMQKMILL